MRRRAIVCAIGLVLLSLAGSADARTRPREVSPITVGEAAASDQSVRLAYLAPRRKRQHAPRNQEGSEGDVAPDKGLREAEARTGAGPTVNGSPAILRGPRWHVDMRDTRGYFARHPAGM
jgi:hypothetical protein